MIKSVRPSSKLLEPFLIFFLPLAKNVLPPKAKRVLMSSTISGPVIGTEKKFSESETGALVISN